MSTSSELKRRRILEAAAELFGEHGYNTNMDSIAKLADVSKQTVYSHFKTKDILFEASMKMKCMENQAEQSIFESNIPIEEALFQFGLEFHKMLLKPSSLNTYRNAVGNVDSHPEFAQIYLRYGPKNTTEMLQAYLEKKVEDGTLKLELSSHDSAVQLLLMLHGQSVYWRYLGADMEQSDEQRDAYLKSCVAMFLSHLRTITP